jgi:FKBP-type peptidyl-prolyl cis-trans isomerase 2
MQRSRTFHLTAAILGITLAFGLSACSKKNSVRTAAPGSFVTVRYALTADNAAVVPDNQPEVLKLRIGDGKFPAKLEQSLIGMPVGAAKAVALKPEEAYGPVRKELVARVPRASLPAGDLKEGMMFGTGASALRIVKVLEDGTVVVDRNHPLAGKSLFYKVRVAAIE